MRRIYRLVVDRHNYVTSLWKSYYVIINWSKKCHVEEHGSNTNSSVIMNIFGVFWIIIFEMGNRRQLRTLTEQYIFHVI